MTVHTSNTHPDNAHPEFVPGRARRLLTASLVAASVLTGSLLAVGSPAAAAPASVSASLPVLTGDPVAAKAAIAVDTFRAYLGSNNRRSLESFDQQLASVAADVAVRLELDPAVLQAAWAKADHAHQVALLAGLSQLGVRYKRNTSVPGVGFDCSGLALFAWGQAGVNLPRTSRDQMRAAAPRTATTAQAGDFAYYPGHLMIWLGVEGAILHSPFTGRNVEVNFVAKRRANSLRYGDPTGTGG